MRLRGNASLTHKRAIGELELVGQMTKNMLAALYIVVLIIVVFGVDFLFFRSRFWER